MRVLVTGATGAIGSAVCDALLARGDEVAGLSRSPDRARKTNPTVTWHAWDPVNERPPGSAFAGVDGVINLVGEEINQRWNDDVKRRIRETRIRATKNLVDAMLAADPAPRTLVSGAAVGIYGLEAGDRILDEDSNTGSDFLAQVVVDWEAAAGEAAKGGVRVATVRTGLVLEPGSGLLKQLLPVFKLGGGGPIAGGDQYMPWIHIDDEVALILWALDNPGVSGPVNLSAPNPVTNREFSKSLGRVLKRPAIFPAPKFAVTALRGGEVADFVTASLRVVPRRALDKGYGFRHPELEPALRDLLGR
ncbi:MAG: TIGR01777 family oxidoreductase [Actinomycetota bacterium]|nr:TIGR01777 family oxidoreductase [Actinomycetota bacterium]